MTIKVYGASDDLIEIEGDIRTEFYASNDKPNFLAFSNGVVLEIGYTSVGVWKISTLKDPWNCVNKYTPAVDPVSENYSDSVIMNDQINRWPKIPVWVVYGHEWGR